MVVLDDAAVGAEGDIHPGFFKVTVPFPCHVNDRGGLSPANAFGFTGDADGAAADADFDKVRSGVRQKAEALSVHHVARAHLYSVAVGCPNPFQRALLPLGIALGGVDDQHVRPGFHQRGNPLGIVTGVDASAYHIALVAVQQLQRVSLVGIIVLAEDKGHQMPILRDDGQRVELAVPDDVVGLFQAGALGGVDELFHGRHKVGDGGGGVHAAHPVVPAGHKAQQLAVSGAVLRDSHGGVAGPLLQVQHIRQRVPDAEIGIAEHEARLVVFDSANHLRLLFDGLGDIDEGDAALPSQADAHLLTRDGLHHGGDHGYVHGQARRLPPAEFDHRRLQRDTVGHAVRGGVAGDQQIFAEGTRGFLKKVCHWATSFTVFFLGYHKLQAIYGICASPTGCPTRGEAVGAGMPVGGGAPTGQVSELLCS